LSSGRTLAEIGADVNGHSGAPPGRMGSLGGPAPRLEGCLLPIVRSHP